MNVYNKILYVYVCDYLFPFIFLYLQKSKIQMLGKMKPLKYVHLIFRFAILLMLAPKLSKIYLIDFDDNKVDYGNNYLVIYLMFFL